MERFHKQQLRGDPIDGTSIEAIRLRNLALSIPVGAELISAVSASEPETRRRQTVGDSARYDSRADLASFYLTEGREYLLALLDGQPSGGLVIQSNDSGRRDDTFEVMREWLQVSYAALLKAVEIDRTSMSPPADKVDTLRFWLEHQLGVSPSREAWLGFLLLAGPPRERQMVRRLLKLDSRADILDSIWGAAWDLMYTRLPSLYEQSMFRKHARLPVTFVTDDSALIDAVASIVPTLGVVNAHGVEFTGDEIDTSAMSEEVLQVLRPYMAREGERILMRSEGMTTQVLRRAAYEVRRGEQALLRSQQNLRMTHSVAPSAEDGLRHGIDPHGVGIKRSDGLSRDR